MLKIAIDNSIIRELDILHTVPCSSCRTAEENRALMNLKNECEKGNWTCYYVKNSGQGYGYYAPRSQQEIKEMLIRWEKYLNNMNCKTINKQSPAEIIELLNENKVKIFLSYFSTKKQGQLYDLCMANDVLVITPDKLNQS